MAANRGKQFEDIIKKSLLQVPDTSVYRLYDTTNGFVGVANIADFIVYNNPRQYFIECKSVHGNRFPLSNLSTKQFEGMLEQSKILGVRAGVICWWIDRDVTMWIPIKLIAHLKHCEMKSIRYDTLLPGMYRIPSEKKRVFCDYDFSDFFRATR